MLTRTRLAAALLTTSALALACGSQDPVVAVGSVDPPGRVLIVGLDGATLERIGPLMAEGKLPHLKSLADAGASGPLRSMRPLLSPRVWTTVATGVSPKEHGVDNWVTPLTEEGLRLMNSHDRRVHALWNIASDAGLSVATVNWLMTYPIEPVNGVVISDLAGPDAVSGRDYVLTRFAKGAYEAVGRELDGDLTGAIFGQTTYPETWAQVAQELMDEREPLTHVPNPFLDVTILQRAASALSDSAYDSDAWVTRMALEVERETSPDVMLVLLQGVDRTCHWLWGGFEPPEAYEARKRFSPEERAAAAETVLAYYEYTDALLGRLLERYEEKDLVLVVSDHGFEASSTGIFRMGGGHHSERAMDGILFARGPGIRPGTVLEKEEVSVLDVTPTVLAWLGLPVADDMQGQPAEFLVPSRPVARTRTYETRPIPRVPLRPAGVEDGVIEQLRSLGYVK
jgi:predicted AlkP superfamily phosphohydrolase/phosphomutase